MNVVMKLFISVLKMKELRSLMQDVQNTDSTVTFHAFTAVSCKDLQG